MAVDFEADENGQSFSTGKHVATMTNISGAAKYTDKGVTGKALAVGGASGVKVGGVGFSFPENSTVSFWIKGKAGNGFNILLAKGPKESGHFEFYTRSGALWCYAPDIGDIDLKYNVNDAPDGWHMLAFVRRDGKLYVYDAGKLVSSVPFRGKIAEKEYDMSFGVLNEGTYGFGGSIDGVRLYERALTEQELAGAPEIKEPYVQISGDISGTKEKTGFDLSEGKAVSIWFKQDREEEQFAILFAKARKASDRHFEIYTEYGKLSLYAPGANNGAAVSLKVDLHAYIGSYHLLTVIHTEGKLITYIDGEQAGEAAVQWEVASGEDTCYYGRLVEGGFDFPGSIAECSLIDEAPDAAAVASAYNSKVVYPEADGELGFESDIIGLEPGGSAPCGIKAPEKVKYTLTLKGGAATLDGETVTAKQPGEAVICAVSDSGRYIAMTLVRVGDPGGGDTEESQTADATGSEPATSPDTDEAEPGKKGGALIPIIAASAAVVCAAAVAAVLIVKKKKK